MICGGSAGAREILEYKIDANLTSEVFWVQSHIKKYEVTIIIRDGACVHSHFIVCKRSVQTSAEAKCSKLVVWVI